MLLDYLGVDSVQKHQLLLRRTQSPVPGGCRGIPKSIPASFSCPGALPRPLLSAFAKDTMWGQMYLCPDWMWLLICKTKKNCSPIQKMLTKHLSRCITEISVRKTCWEGQIFSFSWAWWLPKAKKVQNSLKNVWLSRGIVKTGTFFFVLWFSWYGDDWHKVGLSTLEIFLSLSGCVICGV